MAEPLAEDPPRDLRNAWFALVPFFFVPFLVAIGVRAHQLWVASRLMTWTGLVSVALPVVVVSAIAIPVLVIPGVLVRGTRAARAKVSHYAATHDLQFRAFDFGLDLPGMLFLRGGVRLAYNRVLSARGVFAEAGWYAYWIDRRPRRWQYVAFRLPVALPHLVVEPRAELPDWPGWPCFVNADQRVELGQPFDGHYRVYAPRGYGSDAFLVFPPHVMAALIDLPTTIGLEIVDQWLFCYSARGLDISEPDTWEVLHRIEDTVVDKIAIIANRYVDQHTDPKAYPHGPRRMLNRPQNVRLQGQRLMTGAWR